MPAFHGAGELTEGKVLRAGTGARCCREGRTGWDTGRDGEWGTKKEKLARQAMKYFRARSMRLLVDGGPIYDGYSRGTRPVNREVGLVQPSVMRWALTKMREPRAGRPNMAS